MTLFLALSLMLFGWTAFALSMDRHYGPLFGRALHAGLRRRFRRAGAGAIAGSWGFSVAGRGVELGTVVWVGGLSVTGILVVLGLTLLTTRMASSLAGPLSGPLKHKG